MDRTQERPQTDALRKPREPQALDAARRYPVQVRATFVRLSRTTTQPTAA